MREELGWQATWDLDRGLRAAWDWYERTLSDWSPELAADRPARLGSAAR